MIDGNFNDCLYYEPKDRMWSVSTETEGRTYSYRISESVAIFALTTKSSPKKINSLCKFMRPYFLNCRGHWILPSKQKGAEENSTMSLTFLSFCAGSSHRTWKKKTKGFFVMLVFFNSFKTLIDKLIPMTPLHNSYWLHQDQT